MPANYSAPAYVPPPGTDTSTWFNPPPGYDPYANTSASAKSGTTNSTSSTDSSTSTQSGTQTPASNGQITLPTNEQQSASSTSSAVNGMISSMSSASGQGPGVLLTNASSTPTTYSFYDNSSNGVGTANPSYTNPTTTVTLEPGQSQFVSLPSDFKGRVQKTNGDPTENTWGTASTWVEFQLSASNDGKAHGDVSYQTGDDGAATVSATDGSGQTNGTTQDLLANAPADALTTSATGAKAIANNTNAAATAYLQTNVNEANAYTGTATSGTNDVSSANNQLAITFY